MNCQWTRAPKQKLGGNLTRLLLLPYVRTLRERKTRSSHSRELFFFCKRSKRKTARTQNVSRRFPEQNAAAENQKKYWVKKEKNGKQQKKKKNLRRTLTLVVGKNSSVKHAFPVSTTATTTMRRIALPHLRPLSVPRALSLSLAENFPCPVFPFYPGSARSIISPARCDPLASFYANRSIPVACFPLASVLPVGEKFPCLVFRFNLVLPERTFTVLYFPWARSCPRENFPCPLFRFSLLLPLPFFFLLFFSNGWERQAQ